MSFATSQINAPSLKNWKENKKVIGNEAAGNVFSGLFYFFKSLYFYQ